MCYTRSIFSASTLWKIHWKIHFGNRSLKAVSLSFQKIYHVPWSTIVRVYGRSVKVQRHRHSGNLKVSATNGLTGVGAGDSYASKNTDQWILEKPFPPPRFLSWTKRRITKLYGMVWNGVEWYGMIWCGMVLHGIVQCTGWGGQSYLY